MSFHSYWVPQIKYIYSHIPWHICFCKISNFYPNLHTISINLNLFLLYHKLIFKILHQNPHCNIFAPTLPLYSTVYQTQWGNFILSKKISVIIPCFNATQWLPKCFLSLFKQTIGIENIELIFVDDASTDNNKTWEMLTDIERAFPESIIILKLEKNLRQGGARNIALKYASGEYLPLSWLMISVSTNYFLEAYNTAKTYNCDIVQFEYDYFTESLGNVPTGRKMSPEYIEIHSIDERKHFLITEKLTYGCWNKLYKHELIKKSNVRYAEHCIYEEPLFVYPLLFYADRIVITDKIILPLQTKQPVAL